MGAGGRGCRQRGCRRCSSRAWLTLGKAPSGHLLLSTPCARWAEAGGAVWGGLSHCWLTTFLLRQPRQLQASCAFPWHSPWAQAWLA